jgi:Lrp/AsnC family transcriptional regulator
MSAAALADRCGTTESTVLRRIKALKKTGIVSGPVMPVAPDKVGRGLSIILSIRLERETSAQLEAFRRGIAAHPDVVSCYFVTGTWDYLIILNVGCMGDYDRFLKDMIVGHRVVVASDTHVVIHPIKVGGPLPIDDPSA